MTVGAPRASFDRDTLLRPAVEIVTAAILAVALGALIATHARLALAAVAMVVSVWLLLRPALSAVLLGATIPFVENLIGSQTGTGLKVSASDLLLVLLVSAALTTAVVSKTEPSIAGLRRVAWPIGQYCIFIVLLLAAHFHFQELVKSLQRIELVAFPVIVGSYLALRGYHMRLIKAYVIAASALAVVWPFDTLNLQKNPAGQFISNAILLVIAIPALARYRLLALVLVYGLFATQSRGAIVATAIGLVVMFLVQGLRSPGRTILQSCVVAAAVVIGFPLIPASARERITSFGSTGTSSAARTIQARQAFAADARRLAREHPWLGVGVGSYLDAVKQQNSATASRDPHDVVLLQAAEGGWPFAASFIVLIGGTVAALYRLRKLELVPATAAVLLATVAHGLVDVYWVRGTPLLGWLLVGMVCALAARPRPT